MKKAGVLLLLLITLALTYSLNHSMGKMPALGKFMDPFSGFWQNAEWESRTPDIQTWDFPVNEDVNIYMDERKVPHIFASNDHDLYFAEGYLHARMRLFQMDFMVRVASGRLSEILGPDALRIDRYFRRIGFGPSVKEAMKKLPEDRMTNDILAAYTEGVNAYISALQYKDYPVEYKLLGVKPEPWSAEKTIYMLRLMSYNLTGKDEDLEMTNALKFYGRKIFNDIYPDFPDSLDPIIPVGTPYPEDTFHLTAPPDYIPTKLIALNRSMQPNRYNGSNNWAVAPWKSKDGVAMLANDPHLGLHLPSFWFEIQLHTPDQNAYGASLPGTPGVVIGFNDKIAWGVTNAGRDVKDWYKLKFTDKGRKAYMYDGAARPTHLEVEEIKIKGAPSYYDTILYSHYGPVVYDRNYGYPGDSLRTGLAMKWKALDSGNEIKTFLLLNRAGSYSDYMKAISYFEVPAQNFVFASQDDTIAIWQQGKFPLRWKEQGKFVMDGSDSRYEWAGTIPQKDNPHIVNPARGFVSSANQHPTDSTYPFYYNGYFEYFRNRRVNNMLYAADSHSISKETFQRMHNDNKSLYAEAILKLALPELEKEKWGERGNDLLNSLRYWDHYYGPDDREPVYFEIFWKHFSNLLNEKSRSNHIRLPQPEKYVVILLAEKNPGHRLFDLDSTSKKEKVSDLFVMAFEKTIEEVKKMESENGKGPTWAEFKNTTVEHWISALEAFSVSHIHIGGNYGIVNASSHNHGPSWRMIISLEKPTRAWTVIPGGQSGNPGSPYYSNQIETWANGQYYETQFLQEVPKNNISSFKRIKFEAK